MLTFTFTRRTRIHRFRQAYYEFYELYVFRTGRPSAEWQAGRL